MKSLQQCFNPLFKYQRSLLFNIALWVISFLVFNSAAVTTVYAYDLTEENCRCCHSSGVPDRHHLLVNTKIYECLDCHDLVWENTTQSYTPVVIRDCLVCHVGSLSDRHHIINNDCFACHDVFFDQESGSYYVDFISGCQVNNPQLENCTDGIDNDNNGLIDCFDPYCSKTTECLAPLTEICTDNIDNDFDAFIDCLDSDCEQAPLCIPPQPENCTDNIDNDGDGYIDCQDTDCLFDPVCQTVVNEIVCDDNIDNDSDGFTDCLDTDCAAGPDCQLTATETICNDTVDNDGDSFIDCSDIDCLSHPACLPPPPEICTDSMDNDNDGLIDCADPNCMGTVDCPTPDPQPDSHYSLHSLTQNECTECHLPQLVAEHDQKCNLCHQSTVQAVKDAISGGNKDCLACHSATQHSMKCQLCHGPNPRSVNPKQLPALHMRHKKLGACGVCHMIPENTVLEPSGQYCATCHENARPYSEADVPYLHRLHVSAPQHFPYGCTMCHGKSTPQLQPQNCNGACHNDKSYDDTQLLSVHRTHGPIFDCTNCHIDPMTYTSVDGSTTCFAWCHDPLNYTSRFDLHLQHADKQCWACHDPNKISAKGGKNCESCHGGPVTYSNNYDVHKKHKIHAYQCWICHDKLVPVCPSMGVRVDTVAGSITGMVNDATGNALSNVKVETTSRRYSTYSQPDGSYVLKFIPPGEYTLDATLHGFYDGVQTVTVGENQTVIADYVLSKVPQGDVFGIVTGTNGNFIAYADVTITPGSSATKTKADGAYLFLDIPIGDYSITISAFGYETGTQAVTILDQQSSNLDFVLAPLPEQICDDGIDDDGDGLIDCADEDCVKNLVCKGKCQAYTFYLDADNDGYGYRVDWLVDCETPAGYVRDFSDCNDAEININPGATEICDAIDNNCNYEVDEGVTSIFYQDADGDGYGNAAVTLQACSAPVGYVTDSTDCDDINAAVNPAAEEACNLIDDNCNGQIDEDVTSTFYQDADGDGYGNAAVTLQACSAPLGYVRDSTDCDDINAAVNPAADEACNLIDDNCNGQIDEGVTTSFYQDADGDGYGNAAITLQACSAPVGYVVDNTDCDDSDALVNPGINGTCI